LCSPLGVLNLSLSLSLKESFQRIPKNDGNEIIEKKERLCAFNSLSLSLSFSLYTPKNDKKKRARLLLRPLFCRESERRRAREIEVCDEHTERALLWSALSKDRTKKERDRGKCGETLNEKWIKKKVLPF